jgi:iron complex outermembrane receptor protein
MSQFLLACVPIACGESAGFFEESMIYSDRGLFLRRCFLLLITSFAVLLIGALPADAQTSQVSGTVKDPDQSVVSGARVTLVNTQGAVSLQTTTDPAGQYSFSAVQPGSYRLEVAREGFAPGSVAQVAVSAGQSVTLDIALTLAAASTSITVSGANEGTAATGYYMSHVDAGVMGTAPAVNQP